MTRDPKGLVEQVGQVQAGKRGLPPLEKWHPPLSGDIDIHIARDGRWLYKGEPFQREEIVRLFSTILRREDDGEYYLVTPVEKWRLKVDDAALLAHGLEVEGSGDQQRLYVTTNMGEILTIGKDHPLEIGQYPGSGEPRPVVHVRHGLEARLVTAAYYDLANYIVEATGSDGEEAFGVWSDESFFEVAMGEA